MDAAKVSRTSIHSVKIGLYGGSFDPIHLGHLNLALEIMEKCHLDEVWFCPSGLSPFKKGCYVDAEHRFKMVYIAIQGQAKWRLIDLEIKRPGPSYTFDTLLELHARHTKDKIKKEFFLMMGEDTASTFHRWHKAEEILDLANLLVGKRGEAVPAFQGSERILKAIKQGMIQTKCIEISSTEIRNRLQKRLFCEHLLQAKVLDYILTNDLYLLPTNGVR